MKLSSPPDKAAIRVGKASRTIDYWQQWGQWYARSWPQKSTKSRTPGEVASSGAFSCAATWTGHLSPEVRGAYKGMGTSKGETWVDLFRATARQKAPFGIRGVGEALP